MLSSLLSSLMEAATLTTPYSGQISLQMVEANHKVRHRNLQKLKQGFLFCLFFYLGVDIELKTNRRPQNVSVRYMSIYVTVN